MTYLNAHLFELWDFQFVFQVEICKFRKKIFLFVETLQILNQTARFLRYVYWDSAAHLDLQVTKTYAARMFPVIQCC